MLTDDPSLPANGGPLGDLLRKLSAAVRDHGCYIHEDHDERPRLCFQMRRKIPGGYVYADVDIPIDLIALSANPEDFISPYIEAMKQEHPW